MSHYRRNGVTVSVEGGILLDAVVNRSIGIDIDGWIDRYIGLT